jgi:hypothetical protein
MAAGAFDYYFHVKRFMSLSQSLNENTARMRDRMRENFGQEPALQIPSPGCITRFC